VTGTQSAVIHTDDIDTIGIGSSMETHHVDLVRVDNFWWLAEPASARSAERKSEPEPVSLARRPRLGPNRVAHKASNLVCQPARVVFARVEMTELG
jgi:hypothetical protein